MNLLRKSFKDLYNNGFQLDYLYSREFGNRDVTEAYITTFGNSLDEIFI